MMEKVNPEIILDTRKAKKNGLYPVKLRIIHLRKSKYYPLYVDLSATDYSILKKGHKPPHNLRNEFSEIFMKYGKAIQVISCLDAFSFYEFDRRFLGSTFKSNSVTAYYEEYIKSMHEQGRVGNADSYVLSLKSIKKFHNEKSNKSDIMLTDVTIDWLKSYESYMLNTEKSYATIGIYLRSLRTIYNKAIKDGEAKVEHYPFGKGKYVIPATQRRKKALSMDELSRLLRYYDTNIYEQKARDYWFFSFYSNGMNIFDIAQLTWNCIDGDNIYFIRKKTKHTTKGKQTEIAVHMNAFIKSMIEKYAIPGQKSEYVFPILKPNMTEKEKKVKVKAFTRFINQHIKSLARKVGLTEGVSTVWARHSFTTSVIRIGGSMEFVQESLGHQNMQTTMNYWAGFDHDYRKNISEQLIHLTHG